MTQSPDLNAVLARIKVVEDQIDALEHELEGLEIARDVLQKLSAPTPTKDDLEPLSPTMTVEELVLGALKRSKNAWVTVPQLQVLIADMAGREVPMGTLSPQVSFMKKHEKVVREGQFVAHPSRASKEKLPF